MKLTLGALAIASFWLVSAPHPSAELLQKHKSEAVRQSTKDAASLPLTLRGIPSKQIMVGQQAKFLPDLALLDQDNHQVRFYSDLIKGRNVLISFFYTTCSSTCLWQGKVLSDLQKELGDRLGKDVFLISVTMDPERDTPQRLKTWGEQHGRRKGWTLVTGKTAEMEKLVGHLTGNPLGRLQTHAAFIYLGNDNKSHWIVTYGLSAPKDLIKQIEEL
jgi:protein SCO1/2